MQSYRDGMIQRLSHEIGEVEAETTGCQAEARQRNDVGSRMQQLAQLGISSQIRSAEALASREATSTRCQMADARLKRLNAELTSAQNGVFLRDGTNDVPYSQQQRDRLVLRRQELESEALQNSSLSTQLDREISEERSRLERLGHYDLSLPRNHVVWSVAASPGATITEGQTVFDLADCTHRFIAVEPRAGIRTYPGRRSGLRAPHRQRRLENRPSAADPRIGGAGRRSVARGARAQS
jgi:hypothetical protein